MVLGVNRRAGRGDMDIVKKAILKQGSAWRGGPRVIPGHGGLLARMVPFDGQSAMRARRYDAAPVVESVGRLPVPHRSLSPTKGEGSWFLYVVYSYHTPIAWVGIDGLVVVPDYSYGPTTKHHQNVCRTYLGAAPCGHHNGTMAECAPWAWAGGTWV